MWSWTECAISHYNTHKSYIVQFPFVNYKNWVKIIGHIILKTAIFAGLAYSTVFAHYCFSTLRHRFGCLCEWSELPAEKSWARPHFRLPGLLLLLLCVSVCSRWLLLNRLALSVPTSKSYNTDTNIHLSSFPGVYRRVYPLTRNWAVTGGSYQRVFGSEGRYNVFLSYYQSLNSGWEGGGGDSILGALRRRRPPLCDLELLVSV